MCGLIAVRSISGDSKNMKLKKASRQTGLIYDILYIYLAINNQRSVYRYYAPHLNPVLKKTPPSKDLFAMCFSQIVMDNN